MSILRTLGNYIARMGSNKEFMSGVMKYMDPEAMAEMVNKNEHILPRFVEGINPNVFARSGGTMFSKMRYATYRPPMFHGAGEPSEE